MITSWLLWALGFTTFVCMLYAPPTDPKKSWDPPPFLYGFVWMSLLWPIAFPIHLLSMWVWDHYGLTLREMIWK